MLVDVTGYWGVNGDASQCDQLVGPLISKTCLSRSTGQGLEIPLEDLQIVPVPHRPACVGITSGEAGSGCKGPYPPEPCKLQTTMYAAREENNNRFFVCLFVFSMLSPCRGNVRAV